MPCHNLYAIYTLLESCVVTQKKGGSVVVYREIVQTCSHSEVARAAVDSIGGDFARAFAAEAARHNLPIGEYAARLVGEFAAHADEIDLHNVVEAAGRSDLPLLAGLRYILESASVAEAPPAWMIAATQGG